MDSTGIDPKRPSILQLAADHQHERRPDQRFDRLGFALRALEVLQPPSTDVVVYRSRRLHVQQGRDLRRGSAARWALVGIPEDATALAITLALAEIEGTETGPFRLDLALAAGGLEPEPAS